MKGTGKKRHTTSENLSVCGFGGKKKHAYSLPCQAASSLTQCPHWVLNVQIERRVPFGLKHPAQHCYKPKLKAELSPVELGYFHPVSSMESKKLRATFINQISKRR